MRLGRRPALLVLLLLALFALSGLLAREAWTAGRKRRALADQAIREYASFAAAKYRDNVQAWLYTALDALFAEAWLHLTDGGGGPDAGAAALARSARAFEGCRCGPMVHGRYFFEVPLDGGAAAVVAPRGASPSAAERRWLADTVRAHARWTIAYRRSADSVVRALAAAHSYATVFGVLGDRMPILIYAVREDRRGRPVSAYGLVTDAEHFVTPFFPSLYVGRLVLPRTVNGWAPNDSLISIVVGDSLGRILFYTRAQYVSPLSATVNMDPPLGHLRIRFTVRPSAQALVLAGGLPPSRLPLLLAALGTAAVLTVGIILLVRSELELARQRASFAASVSHELRTPLAQILLFAETVKLGRAPSEQRRAHAVDVIIREAHRLMTLVDNVLHVTRSERGLTRVTLEWIVVRHVVQETVSTFEPLATAAGATLVLEPVGAELLANADPDAVRQMLLNVLDNAVKYGRKGQTIRVGVSYVEGMVQLWVDDEGPGIPAADRSRIWKAFVRLHGTAPSGVPGAGIGLAVVRELVSAQRGRAWVEPGARGGARFVIALPGAIAEEEPDALPTAGAGRTAHA